MKLEYAVILYEGPNNWNARAPDVPWLHQHRQ